MGFIVLLLLLSVRNSCGQVSAAHWTSSSPPKGDIIYTCSGNTATFQWGYVLSMRDALCDVQWFFQSDYKSRQLVAMMSHDKFLPLPEFRERVAVKGNAGLIISNLSVADSGNFSVEVHVYSPSGGSHSLLQRHAHLVVSDQFMTSDGDLHTKRSPVAVMDPGTGRWSAQLMCGKFIFNDNPPFLVEWKTPTGKIRNSTDFREGYFHLLLNNPVRGGNYTCHVPPRHAKRACLPEEDTREATYHVDMAEERMFLLEQESVHLKHELQELQQNFTSYEERTAKREAAASARPPTVAFHATGLQHAAPSSGTPLVFSKVHYNLGNAYNSRTGHFVAPSDGLYYFISSTGPASASVGAYHSLYVNNTQIALAYSYAASVSQQYYSYPSTTWSQMSSVHGVVPLHRGQQVWIQSHGVSYWDAVSSFTGFQLPREL